MVRIGELYWRRKLARELTRRARASVEEILANPPNVGSVAWRIGITGPPGAGKSSILAATARRRLSRGRSIGVLAIDPTSPINGGSLLGDRVRMDDIADEDHIYIRSLPSGSSHDGLCHNITGLLDTFDCTGFDDVMLETVGIGQTSYHAHCLVDTFILTLVPGSGDIIQAMKAGIMELADIYVINKADVAGSEKVAAELRSLVTWRTQDDGWIPPIIMTSAHQNAGFEALDDAIEAHRAMHCGRSSTSEGTAASRHAYQLRAILEQRLDEILEGRAGCERHLPSAFASIAAELVPWIGDARPSDETCRYGS